jgi:hypothetical protein
MDSINPAAAIYLAGHGPQARPRLIELQHYRILRYREALGGRYKKEHSTPDVFIDFQLPRFGMGQVDLSVVPGFVRLHEEVRKKRYTVVYIDLEEGGSRHESGFVRSFLESAGAKVLNAFTDDGGAFKRALKKRCGRYARDYEVTESSDVICFFPSLAAEIAATALRRELQGGTAHESEAVRQMNKRIDALKSLRPYANGATPFIEDRLSAEWRRPK